MTDQSDDDYYQRETAQFMSALRTSMGSLDLHTDVLLDGLAAMAAAAITCHPDIRSRCYARFMNSLLSELRRHERPAEGESIQ